ncbi:MAG: M20/M25/M40 family metallo-hydrolase, partial [Oscillospiraceae bacterium]|nr:M20/M25/M40 family metallo-hydrolase [Oscillospiraceae bacterium]
SSVGDINIIGINGGTKSNAIPNHCKIEFCTSDATAIADKVSAYLGTVKAELSHREPDFSFMVEIGEGKEYDVMSDELTLQLIYILACVPNGVVEMSAEIDGLVESSQTLGILQTKNEQLILHFSLRSNKNSVIEFLQQRLKRFFSTIKCKIDVFGIYPPWEFKSNSVLQEIYKEIYFDMNGAQPKVEAIHAGLECGVFASAIKGLDCIAIGPALYDVHTTSEKLSISSTQKVYALLIELLKRCK